MHQHLTYLNDLGRIFTSRLLDAKQYQERRLLIVPKVLQQTVDGADYMKSKGWSVSVIGSNSLNGSRGSALSVTYSLTNISGGRTPQSYEVKLTCDSTQEWYKNISCKCGRTKEYGRPCYHASLCLVHPHITDINAFVRDPQLFSHGRPCWYSEQFLVSKMIEQYEVEVIIPSFSSLKSYRSFAPKIHVLKGYGLNLVFLFWFTVS